MNKIIYKQKNKIALALFVLVGMMDATHVPGRQDTASLHASGSQDPLPSQANATRTIKLTNGLNGAEIGEVSIADNTDIPGIIDKQARVYLWERLKEDDTLTDKIKTDPYFRSLEGTLSSLFDPNKDKWSVESLRWSGPMEAVMHSTAYSITLPDNTSITMKHCMDSEGKLVLTTDTVQSMQNIDWAKIETVKLVRLDPLTNVLVGPNGIWFYIHNSPQSQSAQNERDEVLERELDQIITGEHLICTQWLGGIGDIKGDLDERAAVFKCAATWIKNNCERLFGYTREQIHFRSCIGGPVILLIEIESHRSEFVASILLSCHEGKLLTSLNDCYYINDGCTQLANNIRAILNEEVHNSTDTNEVVRVVDVDAGIPVPNPAIL